MVTLCERAIFATIDVNPKNYKMFDGYESSMWSLLFDVGHNSLQKLSALDTW